MLSKEERVRTRGMKAPVLRTGRFAYGGFKVLALPAPCGAVVVSKKVSRSAPARNRLRRRIAAILRTLIRAGALEGGIVVYPDTRSLAASSAELRAALERALKVR